MSRTFVFATAFLGTLIIAQDLRDAQACGTNKAMQRRPVVSRVVLSANPSRILLVGERDTTLEKQLKKAGHKVERAGTVSEAQHRRYDLIIADAAQLEAAHRRFKDTKVLKKRSTIGSTVAYAETLISRQVALASQPAQPVSHTQERKPISSHNEGELRTRTSQTYEAPAAQVASSSLSWQEMTSTDSAQTDATSSQESSQESSGNASGWTRSVAFSSNGVELDGSSRRKLKANAAWLAAHPASTLVIEGHSDSVGDASYNLDLSERRAQAARDFLVQLGVDDNRIEIIARGESAPAYAPSSSGKNRRIVLIKK